MRSFAMVATRFHCSCCSNLMPRRQRPATAGAPWRQPTELRSRIARACKVISVNFCNVILVRMLFKIDTGCIIDSIEHDLCIIIIINYYLRDISLSVRACMRAR